MEWVLGAFTKEVNFANQNGGNTTFIDSACH